MAGSHESVDLVPDVTVRRIAISVLLAALMAALSQISIPIPGYPAPFSLQPFGAYFAGLLLGPLWGGFALSTYLLAGIAGAPVFSNGAAGLGYVLVGKGTGGFLVGFLLAAVVVGALVHRGVEPRALTGVSVPTQVVALVAGLVVVYAVGVPWMAYVLKMPLGNAASIMAPYVLPDLAKLAVVVAIVESGDRLVDDLVSA
ncbi:biotin transporter BioY [Halobacteriales archaeon Cl-PHB]